MAAAAVEFSSQPKAADFRNKKTQQVFQIELFAHKNPTTVT